MTFFLIWTGTTDQLMKFKQQINEVHPSIKFDFNFSNKEINFLDPVVYKTQSETFTNTSTNILLRTASWLKLVVKILPFY